MTFQLIRLAPLTGKVGGQGQFVPISNRLGFLHILPFRYRRQENFLNQIPDTCERFLKTFLAKPSCRVSETNQGFRFLAALAKHLQIHYGRRVKQAEFAIQIAQRFL